MSASKREGSLASLPTEPAGRFGAVPQVTEIAVARSPLEVYQRGCQILTTLLNPGCCLVFDRDEYGQLGLAYRVDAPGRDKHDTAPLAIVEQVQNWWMTLLQQDTQLRTSRPLALPGRATTYVAPLLAADALHGMVVLESCIQPLLGDVEREAVAALTTMSLVLHTQAQEKLLQSAATPEQVGEAITQERRRIAREIHDGVAQSLAYLNLKAELLDRLVEKNPVGAREQAGQVRQLLQSAMADLRRCIGDLRRPTTREAPAITAQLRSLASSLTDMPKLELSLQQVSGARLAPEVERTVIGIVREGLHNIRKHAAASSVRVEVTSQDDTLRVLVADDGRGFTIGEQVGEAAQHFGLTQMHELAQELGGELAIASQPGAGTRVEALIPLRSRSGPADVAKSDIAAQG